VPSVAELVEDHVLRSLAGAEDYDAGHELAARGLVRFEEFSPMHVRALVIDDEPCVVDLHAGPGKLGWSCSEGGGSHGPFCRHCVATAIETRRLDSPRVGSDPHRVEGDPAQ
jgi:hypothetical protein